MSLSVVILNSREKIVKQIEALEYQITIDKSELDRKIHLQAIKELKESLK